MRDSDRLCRTRAETAEIPVWSFAFGFVGLLCAMGVGLLSAARVPPPNSVDYGYDERLEGGSESDLSCSDKGVAVVGATVDNLNDLRASAIVARGGPQSIAKLRIEAIGALHAE